MAVLGYRAAGRYCAVNFSEPLLAMPPRETVLGALSRLGFRIMHADPAGLARQLVGKSKYRRGALPSQAPGTVDCSTMVKWAYGRCGICLPRYSIDQRSCGALVDFRNAVAGDLLFFAGRILHYDYDREDGVGHVGIVSGEGRMIHAAGPGRGVAEDFVEEVCSERNFRGVRRYIPRDAEVVTLRVPAGFHVEYSIDVMRIALQNI